MSLKLLKEYVRFVLESAKDARVPNQLVGNEGTDQEDDDEAEDVKEFSGVGAIAGFTAPLGYSAEDMQPNSSKKKKR